MSRSLSVPSILPLTVLSGFLGSGKTSLLNRVLKTRHGRKVAVVVNEFGEIGVDGALIEGSESFVELDNGCLCCALNQDLVTTLIELGKRPDLDQVIVETTGLADPLPVGHVVIRPELSLRYRLDAVVTTVDCLNIERALKEAEETSLQIRRADLLVLTKTDLVDETRLNEVRTLVQEQNSRARLLNGRDETTLKVLLDAGFDGPVISTAGEHTHLPHETCDHSCPSSENRLHGRHSFTSVSFDVGRRTTIRLAFEEFLESLPESIYRAKGIVRIAGEPGTLIFHVVGGRVDLWQEPNRYENGRLVFIGRDPSRENLTAEINELFQDAGS